jgi:uncharacterized repeat protein (TIGR02543 family)
VWSLDTFTIRFTAGAGGSLIGTTTYAGIGYGTTWGASGITVPTPAGSSLHYSFAGWTPALPAATDAITQDASYTANFVLDSHSITYHADSATSGSVPAASVHPHGTQVTVAAQGSLLRTGYTFTGWSTDSAALSVTHGSGVSLHLTNDTHLYAVWSQNPTYVLTYAPGAPASEVSGLPAGASGLTPGRSIVVGSAPVREGYAFEGWASSMSASFQPGQAFSMPAANVTLTATWREVASFTVSYDANGGSGSVPTDNGRYRSGDTVTVLSSPVPVREGYRFGGWSLSVGGAALSEFAITADTTLYALWEEDAGAVVAPSDPEAEGAVTPDEPSSGAEAVAGVSGLAPEEMAQLEAQTGDIFADIAAGVVPLGNPLVTGAWSLLSLIFALLALISTLILLFSGFIPRKRSNKAEDDKGAEQTHSRGRYLSLKVVALVAGILASVVWLIFDDISLPMVWINSWTIFVAALFVIHLVVMIAYIVVRRKGVASSLAEGSY